MLSVTGKVEEVHQLMAHPYESFETSALWTVLHKAILDLEDNADLKLTTRPEYVVGYLCKELHDHNLVVPSTPVVPARKRAHQRRR